MEGLSKAQSSAQCKAWHRGHCQPSTPIPIPFQPHPRPLPDQQLVPSSASQPLQKSTISVLFRRSTLRFLPGNAAMWPTPSHVPPWGPCPALTTTPRPWDSLCPAPEPPRNWEAAWHIQWDPHLARSRQEGAGKTGSVLHTSSPFLLPAGMEPPPSPSSPPPSTPPPPPASQPGTSLFSLGPGWGGGVGGQGRAGSPQPPPR